MNPNTNYNRILKSPSEIGSKLNQQTLFFGRIVEYKFTNYENFHVKIRSFCGYEPYSEEQKSCYSNQAKNVLIEIFGVDGVLEDERKLQILNEILTTSSTFNKRIQNCATVHEDDLWQIYKEILKLYIFKNIATIDELSEILNLSNEYDLEKETIIQINKVLNSQTNHLQTGTNTIFLSQFTISDSGYICENGFLGKAYFNQDMLLADPTMIEWNFNLVKNNSKNLDEVTSLLKTLVDIFPNPKFHEGLFRFVPLCLKSNDAQSKVGQLSILNRIIDITTSLEKYLPMLHVKSITNHEKPKILIIKEIIKKIIAGGNSFPDAAIYYLSEIEISLNLLMKPEYFPNLLVILFKRSLIKDIVGDVCEKNIMYFTYALKFNEILGLSLQDKTLTYPLELSEKTTENVFQLVKDNLTVENLVKFTVALPQFDEYMNQFQEEIKQQHHYISCAIKGTKVIDTNEQKFKLWQENFYKEKAIQLFVTAGFLILKK